MRKDRRTDVEKLQARHDGDDAFQSGLSEFANPHPVGTSAFTDWLLGYEASRAMGWRKSE